MQRVGDEKLSDRKYACRLKIDETLFILKFPTMGRLLKNRIKILMPSWQ